ncbi:DNA-binding response regulator [Sporanaerobium hydrogeniformans]|uniref:DNA-binding response regulator n=1 Tax=Sporanaerobium hydrogeniformans TaxID=3072179 RepID=A0AC61DC43_9FIRM|nr:response regulator transcription factor [Sporanaerobium hydrogeniformans]PHV70800.1 DNA-binding response regulator [Sporanaerobium hydrogeniformans]
MEEAIRILVVEDDDAINMLLCKLIDKNGYKAQGAYSGTEAMLYLGQGDWQMVILDLNLPGLNGEEILKVIREKGEIPVIVISARIDKETKINVLRAGADDYITKPFDLDEVAARIATNLRRRKVAIIEPKNSQLIHKNICLDRDTKEVSVGGITITLTVREYGILELLLTYPKKIFSKANLFESVWGEDYMGDDNTVNVHMSNLRNKLGKNNPNEEYIETIWGMGYRLK